MEKQALYYLPFYILISFKPEAANETMLSLVLCLSWVPRFSKLSTCSAHDLCFWNLLF